MRRLFSLFFFLLVAFTFLKAADVPDFRYPKTVARDAESDLKRALKVGDGEGTVDALIRYSLAWSSISEENLQDILTRLENVANQPSTAIDTRALLLHLEALVIESHPNRWQHFDLWERIDSLYEESLRDLPALTQYPLRQYSRIIDFGSKPYSEAQLMGQQMLPTLAEFLLFHTRERGHLHHWSERKHFLRLVIEKERQDSIEQARVYRERQDVNVGHPEILGSHDSLRLGVSYYNVNHIRVEILEIPDTLKKNARLPRKLLKSVARHEVSLPLVKPDTFLNQTIVLPPLPYGQYVIDHSFIDPKGERKHVDQFFSYDSFHVTDVEEVGVRIVDRESSRREDNEFLRLLVERESGRPIEKADPADNNYRHRYYYETSGSYTDTIFFSNIITDRGLYRPGENIGYTVVVQGNTVDQRHLLSDRQIIIELLNTERKRVLADTLTTDEFGQAKGSFALPANGRTGRFHLHVSSKDNKAIDGWQSVSVSEYKAPTFDIDFCDSPTQVKYADSLFTIKGRVMSFSGVPVSKREVRISLSRHSWWRSYQRGDEFSAHTVWTDSEGRFALELTTPDVAGKSPSGRTYITVKAVCTNAGGETQENDYSLMIEADDAEDSPEPLIETQTSADQPRKPADLTTAMIPDSAVLWIHEMFDKGHSDTEALVRIGTSVPDAYIYYIVSDVRGTLKHGWLHYAEPGLHDFSYPMPKPAPMDEYPGVRELHLQFMAVRFGQVHTKECTFTPATDPDQIHIARQTFRDHLIPGGQETWTFRIHGTRLNQLEQRSRLLIGLYDAALDKIEPFKWSYTIPMAHRSSSGFEICGYYGYRSRTTSYIEPLNLLDPDWPVLNLYGERFFDVRSRSKGKGVLYAFAEESEPMAMATPDNFVMKEASDDVLEEVVVLGYGAMRRKNAVSNGNQLTSVDGEEDAMMDAETAAQSLAGVKMREGQTRLALWEPMLTTDSAGIVSLTFEVPDQNTTWHMQALALSPWGTFAQFDTTLLAQRPLMVQPSLPRFVRQGDQMQLPGIILNATDTVQQVTALVEVFDPRSQQVITTHASQILLNVGEQRGVEVTLHVPDTLQQLAYRIRASITEGEYSGFGDGEQRLLPVLPAVSPVVESIPFYLDPGDEAYTIELPDSLPDGAEILMEWCDNPIVYCLEALPSLMNEVYPTSSSLMHRIFAYGISEQIVHRYPEAMADSLLAELKKLQNADGGFSWIDFEHRYSSLYATAEVLELLGELHQLDAYVLPEPMTTEALKFYDKRMTDYYDKLKNKERKRLDCSYFSHYLYLHSLYPEYRLSAKEQKLYKTALKQCADRWGELDLAGRGYVALALHRQSTVKHQRVAREIVESLRQFSLTHPHRGMYWDQLEYAGYRWLGNVSQTSLLLQAFAAIDPRIKELDQIRKWLLLEKQTTNWGNASLAADAVYALLSSGSDWQSRKQIDGLRYDSIHDRLLWRDTLSVMHQLPAGTRRVEVPAASAEHPSWGAVYMKYAAPTRTAEAASNEEIRIQKELLDAEGKVIPFESLAQGGSGLKVGDKVTIRLRITTTREMDEVQVCDERAACFEPVDQLSGYRWGRELGYYLEPLDQRTLLFLPHVPKGEHWVTYDVRITSLGDFALGLTSVQCQYAPMFNAHTEGRIIKFTQE